MRILLWGKLNFNDLSEWEDTSESPSEAQLEKWSNRIPNVVEAGLKLVEPYDSILEISAGFGNFIGKVSADKERHATEFCPAAVEHLNSRGIESKKAVLPTLPYDDGSFDLLATFSVFEHLAHAVTVRASFKESHRLCRKGMVFSVPFDCMQPWNTLIHNFDFTKELVLQFTRSPFEMESWEVVKDGRSTRSICFLKKI
jgi:ubiquinone/menaquinone biosynthesis C-methylase UbiE